MRAGCSLGVGAGVNADIDMAKDCYKQAAHAGLIRPQVNLGYVALRCQQYNKAVKHFRVRPYPGHPQLWVAAEWAHVSNFQAQRCQGAIQVLGACGKVLYICGGSLAGAAFHAAVSRVDRGPRVLPGWFKVEVQLAACCPDWAGAGHTWGPWAVGYSSKGWGRALLVPCSPELVVQCVWGARPGCCCYLYCT